MGLADQISSYMETLSKVDFSNYILYGMDPGNLKRCNLAHTGLQALPYVDIIMNMIFNTFTALVIFCVYMIIHKKCRRSFLAENGGKSDNNSKKNNKGDKEVDIYGVNYLKLEILLAGYISFVSAVALVAFTPIEAYLWFCAFVPAEERSETLLLNGGASSPYLWLQVFMATLFFPLSILFMHWFAYFFKKSKSKGLVKYKISGFLRYKMSTLSKENAAEFEEEDRRELEESKKPPLVKFGNGTGYPTADGKDGYADEKKIPIDDTPLEKDSGTTSFPKRPSTKLSEAYKKIEKAFMAEHYSNLTENSPTSLLNEWKNLPRTPFTVFRFCYLCFILFAYLVTICVAVIYINMPVVFYASYGPPLATGNFKIIWQTVMLYIMISFAPFIVTSVVRIKDKKTLAKQNLFIIRTVSLLLLFAVLLMPSFHLLSVETAFNTLIPIEGNETFESCLYLPDKDAFYSNLLLTSTMVGTGLEMLGWPELYIYIIGTICCWRKAEDRQELKKSMFYEYPKGLQFCKMLLLISLSLTYCLTYPILIFYTLMYTLFVGAYGDHKLSNITFTPVVIDKLTHGVMISFFTVFVTVAQIYHTFRTIFNYGLLCGVSAAGIIGIMITVYLSSSRFFFKIRTKFISRSYKCYQAGILAVLFDMWYDKMKHETSEPASKTAESSNEEKGK